jgi:MYXO-CTERM domain-containing protein
MDAAACITGACICLGAPGTADAPADAPDLGADPVASDEGCDAAPGNAAYDGAFALVFAFFVLALRRRLHA